MDDFYNIDKTEAYAELRIFSPRLDVQKVSQLLDLEIDCVRKGFYKVPEQCRVIANEDGDCFEYVTKTRHTYDLAIQLEELRRVFRSKIKALQEIKALFDECTIDVSIVVFNRQRLLPAFRVTAKQIEFLAAIGTKLEYDVYD